MSSFRHQFFMSATLNQYTAITAASSTTAQQHDFDGNLISDGTWTYTWDAENRLVVMENGTTTLSFAYDSQSRRIAKTTPTGTTRFIYDNWNLVAEIDSNNNPIRKHLWVSTSVARARRGWSRRTHRNNPRLRWFPFHGLRWQRKRLRRHQRHRRHPHRPLRI
ncbi:MAG: hypothetical protein HC820_02815 [Hydrococcus sp. RM1_1_31]|nr:hypothetical protein [Hydrococcus sp. RM1_1_31]